MVDTKLPITQNAELSTASAAEQQSGGSGGMWFLLIITGLMFYMMRKEQKKKRQKQQQLISSLRIEDDIITDSGIIGMIIEIGKEHVVINSAGSNLKVLKSNIFSKN